MLKCNWQSLVFQFLSSISLLQQFLAWPCISPSMRWWIVCKGDCDHFCPCIHQSFILQVLYFPISYCNLRRSVCCGRTEGPAWAWSSRGLLHVWFSLGTCLCHVNKPKLACWVRRDKRPHCLYFLSWQPENWAADLPGWQAADHGYMTTLWRGQRNKPVEPRQKLTLRTVT